MKNKKFSWKDFWEIIGSYLFAILLLPAIYSLTTAQVVSSVFDEKYLIDIIVLFCVIIVPFAVYKGIRKRK